MSASREKNKRKEQAAVPETANNAKKGMSKGLKTTLIAVCTVLVVCIVVFFYMLTSGVPPDSYGRKRFLRCR